MARFFRLFGEQYLGFWSIGLLLFAIQEIPYMIMPILKPQPNPIMDLPEYCKLLAVAEGILGSACIALMVFVVRDDVPLFSIGSESRKAFFFLACAALLLNFIGWGIYFAGTRTPAVMLAFIVAMPPLYYLFIGLWRGNTPLIVAAAVFLPVHFIHVSINLR